MASARMTEVYEKLYKAVCNQSTNNVVTAAHELLGKPVLFVDEYFHVVSMHPSSPIGLPQWDSIYQNKALNREQILKTLDEFLSGKRRFTSRFTPPTGSCEESPCCSPRWYRTIPYTATLSSSGMAPLPLPRTMRSSIWYWMPFGCAFPAASNPWAHGIWHCPPS